MPDHLDVPHPVLAGRAACGAAADSQRSAAVPLQAPGEPESSPSRPKLVRNPSLTRPNRAAKSPKVDRNCPNCAELDRSSNMLTFATLAAPRSYGNPLLPGTRAHPPAPTDAHAVSTLGADYTGWLPSLPLESPRLHEEPRVIDPKCLGPDVHPASIHPDARVVGCSYLTGARTRVAAGAVIINSRLHDVQVSSGARIENCIILAEGRPHEHKCDAAGRTVVRGAAQPSVGQDAQVAGSTLLNTSIGPRSRVAHSWLGDCQVGEDCRIEQAKLIITNTARRVTVTGPTEVSEAWLGEGLTIDRRGYCEGVFGNRFLQVRFDQSARRLKVIGAIHLPHVSRYGTNTINSTNSGKLLPLGGAALTDFGVAEGLWRGKSTLSHDQIELGPCCWVVPWTKVVGQSNQPHADDEALVSDELTTYLMPFAMAGVGGELTRGLVMPGELSVGLGPKQRKGAWVFTYAPDAVINMVARLWAALPDERKPVADTVVVEALRTAEAMTQALAHRNGIDLSRPVAQQRPGWGRWLGQTWALLRAHLDGGLWEFRDGRPAGWRREGERWTHARVERLLAAAPDALKNQKSEAELFAFEDPVPPVETPVFLQKAARPCEKSATESYIGPDCCVHPTAHVAPGCRLEMGTIVEAGAEVWNSSLSRTRVGTGAVVQGSHLDGCGIDMGAIVRDCTMFEVGLGARSTSQFASISRSSLAAETTVSAFADVRNTRCRHGTIIGGAFHDVTSDVYLMSMHLAGHCQHLRALLFRVTLSTGPVDVPAIPMIGGGAVIRGTPEEPVRMQCAFIGSNSIIEPGAFIGFGAFTLGRLGPGQTLLPFSISTDEDERRHHIGGVLSALPGIILTHYLPWTFNAAGAEVGAAVAEMVRQAIAEGLAAVQWEMARRAGKSSAPAFEQYRSLAAYSAEQLQAGQTVYRRALESGAWDMAYRDGRLVFTNEKGHWTERNGSAFWQISR